MKVKFLSLNLWHGELIIDAVDFLEKENADIVILQEVHNGTDSKLPKRLRSLTVIQDRLKYPFHDYVPGALFHYPEGKIPNGNAILSKFPIVNSDAEFLDETFNNDYYDLPKNYPYCPRILQHVALKTPIGEVNVYNLHGVWDLDGDNYSDRRRNMSEIIIKAVSNKRNVLLGGDTNAKPTNEAMQSVEKHLTSVFGNEIQTTFNMQRKDNPGYATAAVDMLFVSPDIKVLSKNCPNVNVSDHLPVIAELAIS